MSVTATEPDWNLLSEFGLPINIRQSGKTHYSYDTVINNIILASLFLIENRNDPEYNRYSDAFKALLLVLKIHYPTKFLEIENKAGLELTCLFNLDNVSGRDIKLRNICLSRVAENYKMLKNN